MTGAIARIPTYERALSATQRRAMCEIRDGFVYVDSAGVPQLGSYQRVRSLHVVTVHTLWSLMDRHLCRTPSGRAGKVTLTPFGRQHMKGIE